MKFRTDFVTNSSSSSFICVFKNKDDMLKSYEYLCQNYSSYASTIINDIKRNKKTRVEIMKELKSFYEEQAKWVYIYSKACKDWEKLEKDKEVKKECREYVESCMKKAEDGIPKRGFLASVEYGDDDEFYGELEHYIMPYLSFVFETISHH